MTEKEREYRDSGIRRMAVGILAIAAGIVMVFYVLNEENPFVCLIMIPGFAVFAAGVWTFIGGLERSSESRGSEVAEESHDVPEDDWKMSDASAEADKAMKELEEILDEWESNGGGEG